MTPSPAQPKPQTVLSRLLFILREPGEGATLTVAILAALISGGAGLKMFQGEGSINASVAQGVFTVAAVFIVYYFRDKMRKTDRSAEIHKTDTAAQLDFVKIVQDLTNNLNTANSERLREQRDSYRQTIARLNNKHSVEIAAERSIKHQLGQILNAALLSMTTVRVKIKLGVCTEAELYEAEQDRPEHFRKLIDELRIVPRPALEPDQPAPHDPRELHDTPTS